MKIQTTNYLFTLPTRDKDIINSNSIIRIEASSNYCKLYFDCSFEGRKTLVVAKVLSWFEERLPTEQFIRIHRTHFVNKDFISCYINGTSSKVQLFNGEQIDIARRKKNYFIKEWCRA